MRVAIEHDPCEDEPCPEGARCVMTRTGDDYQCNCLPGYRGDNCQIRESFTCFQNY